MKIGAAGTRALDRGIITMTDDGLCAKQLMREIQEHPGIEQTALAVLLVGRALDARLSNGAASGDQIVEAIDRLTRALESRSG